MAIHESLKREIKKAIKESGQNEVIATRLVDWLDELGEGRETLTNDRQTKDRISLILKDIKVQVKDED